MVYFFRICVLILAGLGSSFCLRAHPTPIDTSATADIPAFITIGSVSVEGNYRTRTTIILREMALRAGDSVQANQLDERLEIDRRKIVNTNLFVTVDMLHFPDNEDSTLVNIRVVVKERWYFVIVPVFQLADRNFNEWWYDRDRDLKRITYGLYMSYNNLTGRADKLRLLAEFGFIPKYEISYSVPYIDKAQKTGVTAGMSYTTNKTLPYRTWNDKLDYFNSESLNRERFYTFVNFTRRNKFYSFHSLDLRWNYLQLSDTLARLNPEYLLQSRKSQNYFQLTYTYNYDRRDNVQYPLEGFNYGLQVSKLGLLPTDNTNQTYLYGWYKHFIPINKRWFFNSGITGRMSAPVRQPYPQTLGLGYRMKLVRGYELYVIDGQHYFLWENELKYKLFSFQKTFPWIPVRQFSTIPITAYLNSFADLGYVQNYYPELSNTKLGNTLLSGAGVGLDVATFYNMVFRFNYTINGLGQDRFFFQIGRVL
ncbi:BamA/TamA family outer membrane protein [Arundinibacter roseus]|uniref:Outer membrane protein assembly factor n=1 Tax=Arundinibacter roseus TaxID=2070510 RepID=A0A4V2X9J7_9BACT|nr:BamA/TamA family outer membrane protein [Arundinibacter roseus]TDB64095.1 outer membrane protein assembly factor [Arundinibacter roseus]